jgi:hypothetical protein
MRETARTSPSLRINPNTHGVLCDEDAWVDCSLSDRDDWVHVSADAARPKTFFWCGAAATWNNYLGI